MKRNNFLILFVLSVLSFPLFLTIAPETYLHEASIHLALLSLSLFFLWKGNLKDTLKSVGFPGNLKTTIKFTILGIIAILIMSIIVGTLAYLLGFNDQHAIVKKVSELPLYLIVFAVVVPPITEESFFRAVLVPKFGVLPSALLFGISHFAYGSSLEVIGAFAIGIILGYVYKYSRSITPVMLIHFIYNLISLSVMLTTMR